MGKLSKNISRLSKKLQAPLLVFGMIVLTTAKAFAQDIKDTTKKDTPPSGQTVGNDSIQYENPLITGGGDPPSWENPQKIKGYEQFFQSDFAKVMDGAWISENGIDTTGSAEKLEKLALDMQTMFEEDPLKFYCYLSLNMRVDRDKTIDMREVFDQIDQFRKSFYKFLASERGQKVEIHPDLIELAKTQPDKALHISQIFTFITKGWLSTTFHDSPKNQYLEKLFLPGNRPNVGSINKVISIFGLYDIKTYGMEDLEVVISLYGDYKDVEQAHLVFDSVPLDTIWEESDTSFAVPPFFLIQYAGQPYPWKKKFVRNHLRVTKEELKNPNRFINFWRWMFRNNTIAREEFNQKVALTQEKYERS